MRRTAHGHELSVAMPNWLPDQLLARAQENIPCPQRKV
jgi:hypothetical protein